MQEVWYRGIVGLVARMKSHLVKCLTPNLETLDSEESDENDDHGDDADAQPLARLATRIRQQQVQQQQEDAVLQQLEDINEPVSKETDFTETG